MLVYHDVDLQKLGVNTLVAVACLYVPAMLSWRSDSHANASRVCFPMTAVCESELKRHRSCECLSHWRPPVVASLHLLSATFFFQIIVIEYSPGNGYLSADGMGGNLRGGNLPKKHGHCCIVSCHTRRHLWETFFSLQDFLLSGISQDLSPVHNEESRNSVVCTHCSVVIARLRKEDQSTK